MGKERVRAAIAAKPFITRDELWNRVGAVAARLQSEEEGRDVTEHCRAIFNEAWDAVQSDNNN